MLYVRLVVRTQDVSADMGEDDKPSPQGNSLLVLV
jgi:hypothetical protein